MADFLLAWWDLIEKSFTKPLMRSDWEIIHQAERMVSHTEDASSCEVDPLLYGVSFGRCFIIVSFGGVPSACYTVKPKRKTFFFFDLFFYFSFCPLDSARTASGRCRVSSHICHEGSAPTRTRTAARKNTFYTDLRYSFSLVTVRTSPNEWRAESQKD